jgi:hypothetical protein
METSYTQIALRAILDGKDPVHEMNKAYRMAYLYGSKLPPPPTLTISQSSDLLRLAAESDSSMSHLFNAFLEALAKGSCAVEDTITASMEKGLGKKPPTSPTINVYTKDSVIHNVPQDKLTEMGPETLASVVTITDEMPWSESRVAAFKKEQGKRLDEAAAAKATKEKAERARALNVNEDVWSCGSEAETRRVVATGGYFHADADLKALLERCVLRDQQLETLAEDIGGVKVPWSVAKLNRVNAQIKSHSANAKKAKRKDQIDELVSKLLKERNEL